MLYINNRHFGAQVEFGIRGSVTVPAWRIFRTLPCHRRGERGRQVPVPTAIRQGWGGEEKGVRACMVQEGFRSDWGIDTTWPRGDAQAW